MKEIHEAEFDKFLHILKPYHDHIVENPSTLISRFFGLHKVLWKDSSGRSNTKCLVIMNNVFKFKDFDIGVRFDLKGSSQGRAYL